VSGSKFLQLYILSSLASTFSGKQAGNGCSIAAIYRQTTFLAEKTALLQYFLPNDPFG
jgi:hypothetical protein